MTPRDEKIDDGGPAFPSRVQDEEVGAHWSVPGMTLCDWFAGQALGGMLANPESGAHQAQPQEIAEWAYRDADAMLAARQR